jgi:hypothetical protein
MIEVSRFRSIPLTSGSGSRRSKNIWIRRIRIRNTGIHKNVFTLVTIILELTIVGTKGGGTRRMSSSSQLTFLKKACFFTSSASRSVAPSRRSGFFRSSCTKRRHQSSSFRQNYYGTETNPKFKVLMNFRQCWGPGCFRASLI